MERERGRDFRGAFVVAVAVFQPAKSPGKWKPGTADFVRNRVVRA